MEKRNREDGESPLHMEIVQLWKVFGKPRIDEAVTGSENGDALKVLLEENNSKTVCAVCDVSFMVNRGEVFVIMGLSGSGKSTLIRCLARLIEPSSGQIKINGRSVTAMNSADLTTFRRSEIAMVFQHYGLLPHRTVLDNVAFGLKLRGEKRDERRNKARKIIENVGLSGWEGHYPAQLSGGMQQRAGLARALVQDAAILLMDEPFSGLDPLIRREMQEELLRLQKELQKTIVFVTHDLGEALRLGDRMAVMKDGKFVQVGTPRQIVLQPADEYVRRFVQDEQKTLAPSKHGAALPQHRKKPWGGPMIGSC